MKVLDILKKFKDEIKIELDLYDEKSYENAIDKIDLLRTIIKSLDNEKKLFNLDRFFFITNIDSEPSTKPYIISSLDYDTMGVEIDYNLLAMLRIDVSDFASELEAQLANKDTDKFIKLSTEELYIILNDVIINLSRKIANIDLNHKEIAETYENLCDLYESTDVIEASINKNRDRNDSNENIKELRKELSDKHDMYKAGFKLVVDNIKNKINKVKNYKNKTNNYIKAKYNNGLNKLIKVKSVLYRKMSKLKILLMFKNMEIIAYVEKKTNKTKRKI